MRHLLDVNVLLALGNCAHPDHEKARQWFASLPATDGLASCSITEIGFLRVSINARLAANLGEAKTVLAGLLSVTAVFPSQRRYRVRRLARLRDQGG
jgi:predicted nucleic acid-binding protein